MNRRVRRSIPSSRSSRKTRTRSRETCTGSVTVRKLVLRTRTLIVCYTFDLSLIFKSCTLALIFLYIYIRFLFLCFMILVQFMVGARVYLCESYFSISAAEPFRYVARQRLFPRYYGTFFPHRQRIIINPFGRSRLQRRKNQQQHHRAAQNRHRNVFSAKSRSTYRLRRNLRNSHRY